MSMVNIVNVQILNNPCSFFDPFQIEITFEVISELQEDLEFKIVYVGSAESEQHDQTLVSVMVGPVPVGASKFLLEAPAPDPNKIPSTDIVGVTVLLLMCSYRDREFVRVGYYVNNDYTDEQMREEPPETVELDKLRRAILADKPRVTRFSIPWDNDEKAAAAAAQQDISSALENDENAMAVDTDPNSNNASMASAPVANISSMSSPEKTMGSVASGAGIPQAPPVTMMQEAA